MKKLIAKTAFPLIMTFVILITAVFSGISYAWLANYLRGGEFEHHAKKLPPFTLEVAKIQVPLTEAEANDPESKRSYFACTDHKMEANADGTHLAVELGNMSFGAIDNVAQLKNENIMYLRLTVPKSIGKTVKYNIHYNTDDYIILYKNVYDADGNVTGVEKVNDATLLANLKKIETAEVANDSYLLYSAVVSNTAYEASQIAANVTFDENTYNKFTTDGTTLNEITITDEQYNAIEGDNYYVYLKVIPNLAVFAYSIESISDIMPCYVYFKVSAEFEVKEEK